MSSRSLSQKRAVRKLSDAMVERRSVRVLRSIENADVIDGFVVAIGDNWVLVQRENGQLSVDGWAAVRLKDIAQVSKRPKHGTPPILERVMTVSGEWPPHAPSHCDIRDLASLISTAQTVSRLMTIHRERKLPNSFRVGMLRSIDDDYLDYESLSPSGEWEEPHRVRNKSITRIEFGTEYADNLAKVMPPVPTD